MDKPQPQVLKTGVVLPDWIKNNAEWWSSDQITNDDFSLGIEFMINNGYIKLPTISICNTHILKLRKGLFMLQKLFHLRLRTVNH